MTVGFSMSIKLDAGCFGRRCGVLEMWLDMVWLGVVFGMTSNLERRRKFKLLLRHISLQGGKSGYPTESADISIGKP